MTSPLRHVSFVNPDGTMKSSEQVQRETAARIADARERAQQVGAEIAATVVEATSRNGAATVSVQATGLLHGVRLTDRVKSMTPPQIAAAVMEAYRAAGVQAAARTREIAAEGIPDQRVVRLMDELVPGLAEFTEDADSATTGRG